MNVTVTVTWDLSRNAEGTWRLGLQLTPEVLRVIHSALTEADLDGLQDTLRRGRVLDARGQRTEPPVFREPPALRALAVALYEDDGNAD